jgi:dipeptidyl aminopeptidase/acylaminoacyl peptidase
MNRIATYLAFFLVILSASGCTDPIASSNKAHVTRVAAAFYANSVLKVLDSSGVATGIISCGARCRIRNVEWSRDGEMLAMTANLDSVSALFVANRDGSELRELARLPATILLGSHGTPFLQFSDFQQSWSSDNRLTYVNSGIVISAADGTDRKTLLSGLAVLRPSWAPNDSAITYINSASSQLEIVRIDGTHIKRVVTLSDDVTGHVWSPDGSSVAISTSRSGQGALYVLDSRTLGLRQVSSVPYGSSYCWSPDSRSLSFVHSEPGSAMGSQIHTVSTVSSDGSNLLHITSTPTYLNNRVAWSSNGKAVLFFAHDAQSQLDGLYVDSLGLSSPRRFTTENAIAYFAVSGVHCSYLFNL